VRRFRFTREQFIPLDLDETFAFFADPCNLERLTPPWLHFRILTPADELAPGALIDYQLRLHGLPLHWQSEIAVWDPPLRFVDAQRKGPYRYWEHTHTFEPLATGTIVKDHVIYNVPGGALSNQLFVRRDLDRIFDFRARQLSAWAIGQLRSRVAQ
jgi:ligand-binding SRPBCC domain-containing protein